MNTIRVVLTALSIKIFLCHDLRNKFPQAIFGTGASDFRSQSSSLLKETDLTHVRAAFAFVAHSLAAVITLIIIY